ncbi:hypothetical protein LY625_09635 [Lysobacter sp. GX 14042]|uniref:hypothetical protein n=1 Tax=Lysobacter sp. GX 14042 TaxID=2907155 RepID=UPI001F34A56E|nr:hypothetical protein [Lysobacter sp. GX 14042]MCE7032868.1 hypothetical protein [Lysobacter sp. GX 14042]
MNKHDRTEEEQRLQEALDERADHIPVEELRRGTARADFFEEIHRSLVARGTKLLVGPRGCGKTHMMRYTWLLCRDDKKSPLAVYVTFNRYYRLEPLLKTRSNAIDLFHAWVIARILIALNEVCIQLGGDDTDTTLRILGYEPEELADLVDKLERGLPLTEGPERVLSSISVNKLLLSIEAACNAFGRKRAVILLDDAALTLTPEYLFEFFDIVRVLRTHRVSPKASVYPATDFGPRFHAAHEADEVAVWLSVDHPNYRSLMGAIAAQRLPSVKVSADVDEVLKLAAFGVPRAYLTMLRDFSRSSGTQSQVLNRVIENHAESKREEYRSMAIKMPRFESLIHVGEQLLDGMIRELRDAQAGPAGRGEKQLIVGVPATEVAEALVERMFNLLLEAGLVFEHQSVSHGEGRLYRRYMPHLAALISARAVTVGTRSSAAGQLVEALSRRASKHPLRRTLSKLIGSDSLPQLRIDLPECRVCGADRLTAQQRFCHECGSELLDDSMFARCMSLPLSSVPRLTKWQRERIGTLDRIKTIGDLLAIQDPGSELRKLHRVGNVRAAKIVQMVTAFVDEFLS